MLTSYHNNKKLKTAIVNEMEKHRKGDQIVKGHYGKMNGKFTGCAIHLMNVRLKTQYCTDSHKSFEDAIGVPEWLARLSDIIFEGLPEGDNSLFAVNFLKAIPVGVNLEPVKWHFCAYLLKENIERVLTLKISDELKEQVVSAIRQCLALQENAIKTGVWEESAARSAAESARSAAESAAESAAWSAAESAAEPAAYQKYAKELLKLLKECKWGVAK